MKESVHSSLHEPMHRDASRPTSGSGEQENTKVAMAHKHSWMVSGLLACFHLVALKPQ
jgi:hypothetical protein